MSISVKLKKGLDIRLKGQAEKILNPELHTLRYAVKPIDFPGLTPKLIGRVGDKVLAGSPLFHDKLRPEVVFTSPVSGIVTAVTRGDRRKLLEVVIEKSGDEFIDFGIADPTAIKADEIKEKLLKSGLWPVVRQRPYHIVARHTDTPKAIFVSAFDTAPLAPDYNFIFDNSSDSFFKTGLKTLKRLTEGSLYLAVDGRKEASEVLANAPAKITRFSGPHPAGNVGVQIHHIDPVNKGEVVWYVNPQDVIAIGRLFEEGRYLHERIIAMTGSEVIKPQYYRIRSGSAIHPLTKDNVRPGNLRYISGNVLTGSKIEADGFLGYYDSQITVIPEGDYFEFFGWMMPGLDKFSFYKTFASKLFPKKEYSLDTNFHGGERAFVLTGQYEKVVPMDIYPMQLLKAILAEDIDMMENLGIYEIAEEDFALCEYICSSKIEIQTIVRKGLDLMVREMN
ncbi:MAG TPA: Na(+)-translocating NADH-quinone reductase subunit A [Bacteroidales bacterium]|nr:Na(+)-translocating NADH-quinone reductase subunit A [Bacteroidales bacterium]